MISGTLALAFAAAFTGASFYVNWVEQPARLELDEEALLSEWGPSDSRGVALLAAFALVAAIAGFIAYFESQDVRWAFGALVMILSWPYAFFVMAPLDNQIRSLRGPDVAAARALVRQWGLVESGLTAIGRGGGRRLRHGRFERRGAMSSLRSPPEPRSIVLPGPSGGHERLRLAPPPRPRRARHRRRACAFSPACPSPRRRAARRSTSTASPGRRRSRALAVGLVGRAGPRARGAARPAPAHSRRPCDGGARLRDRRAARGRARRRRRRLRRRRDAGEKLDIMRDSRIGAYGAVALALSLILRVGALAAALDGGFVARGHGADRSSPRSRAPAR